MNVKLLSILLVVLYINELLALRIRKRRDLEFGTQVAGSIQNIVVATSDSGAAKFRARRGTPYASITVSILESSINIIASSGSTSNEQILVDNFTMDAPAYLDRRGRATIYVGASAHIEVDDIPGDYTGTATLRVIEN